MGIQVVGRGERPLDGLLPWADNPRKNDHAVPDLVKSLERWGFIDPIVVWTPSADNRGAGDPPVNTILGGHTRHKAARVLGLTEAPCVFVDCSWAEARALALALNRLSEVARWDEDRLGTIIRELSSGGLSFDGVGFASEELDAYIGDTSATTGFLDDFLGEPGAGGEGLPGDAPTEPLAGLTGGAGGGEEETRPKGMVDFSIPLTADERARVYDALRRAKKATGLRSNREALMHLIDRYLEAE